MKRMYESPVMRAELFEANEYVAGCWDIYCRGMSNSQITDTWSWGILSGKFQIVNENDKHTAHGKLTRVHEEPILTEIQKVEISPIGAGMINNRTKEFAKYGDHWMAEVVDVSSTQHPNASV